jgi:hypothetical protein
MTTITTIDIESLNTQLNALKNVIDNITNVLKTFNNNLTNINNKNTQESPKPKKIVYRQFVINNNDENAKNKVDEFHKNQEYICSKREETKYDQNTTTYINVPMEELVKYLDVSLSNTHILDTLRNNINNIKDYNEHNFSFVFYKNIINTYVIIMKKLLNKVCDEKDVNGKFQEFEQMTEIIMKYSIVFTDKLFTEEFVKFKKVLTLKSLDFSANDGCIAGFLLFAFVNPDMVSEDCHPHLKFHSYSFKYNDHFRLVKHDNIKNIYEKYSGYINDKSKHIFETDFEHSCNKYCDDYCNEEQDEEEECNDEDKKHDEDCEECINRGEYFYKGEFYRCDKNKYEYDDYCKYCDDHCSCE